MSSPEIISNTNDTLFIHDPVETLRARQHISSQKRMDQYDSVEPIHSAPPFRLRSRDYPYIIRSVAVPIFGFILPVLHLTSLVLLLAYGHSNFDYLWLLIVPLIFIGGAIMAKRNSALETIQDQYGKMAFWFSSISFLYLFLLSILGGFHSYYTLLIPSSYFSLILANDIVFRLSLPIVVALGFSVILLHREQRKTVRSRISALSHVLLRNSEISFLEFIVLQMIDLFSLLDGASALLNDEIRLGEAGISSLSPIRFYLFVASLCVSMLSLLFMAVSESEVFSRIEYEIDFSRNLGKTRTFRVVTHEIPFALVRLLTFWVTGFDLAISFILKNILSILVLGYASIMDHREGESTHAELRYSSSSSDTDHDQEHDVELERVLQEVPALRI